MGKEFFSVFNVVWNQQETKSLKGNFIPENTLCGMCLFHEKKVSMEKYQQYNLILSQNHTENSTRVLNCFM